MKSGFACISAFIFFTTISLSVIEPMDAAAGQHRQVTGTVTGIDIRNSTLTVTKKNRNVTLDINDKTSLTQCTNDPELTDIKIGDKVTVKYKENPGENTAKSVTIRAKEKSEK
jgi:Cu/Ag efflux protein CusF